MKFAIDVLIIFADRDNESNEKNESGWVSQFKRFLEMMLTQVLGEKPNILLKSEHDPITAPDLNNVAVLVPALSKSFIDSGRCLDHLEAFYKATSGFSKNRRGQKVDVARASSSRGERLPER